MSAKNEDLERCQRACEALSEHFDTVHIFATRHEPGQEGGTVNLSWGNGNWFARYGQISNWLNASNETTRAEARQKFDEDKD
jgi:hypothetical protein